MNNQNLSENFSGKAESYRLARPGYPEELLDFIAEKLPKSAKVADIGAGTGKLTECLAQKGFDTYAVEPNADMREQLLLTVKDFSNVSILTGLADDTGLPSQSMDAICVAQALHWFDPVTFRAECARILKPNGYVFSIYNSFSYYDENSKIKRTEGHSASSALSFFKKQHDIEFPNPQTYTREKWLTFMSSHSHSPLPDDENYATYFKEVNEIFEREAVDGVLSREVKTCVYYERL
ncbi:class I SAM-dependent methyltransferase [Lactococcus protaetiae]|uniref:Class I SAM-dependent methyltransferase n=1 Tax=Lactococcus protaetiae TaxID=2592653 RepID=A0A514Z8Z0_9LACT|nr:class I SAM-dependent methyltransferase [Lactococcus protaetiae]QDK71023.1 class I SAM-dependent methyltransferase [Lactococcus protaetiae]